MGAVAIPGFAKLCTNLVQYIGNLLAQGFNRAVYLLVPQWRYDDEIDYDDDGNANGNFNHAVNQGGDILGKPSGEQKYGRRGNGCAFFAQAWNTRTQHAEHECQRATPHFDAEEAPDCRGQQHPETRSNHSLKAAGKG